MDEALLQAAAAAGAKVRRGVRVTGLRREGAQVLAATSDGEVYPADDLFLASGKHDVRGWRRPTGPQGDLIGFKQYYVLHPAETRALEGRVELHLFAGGYAGFQPVEGGRANLCLVVRRSAFEAVGRDWEGLLEAVFRASPGLQNRLRGARAERAKPLAVASIPYGLVVREAQGIWRLGDQAAVIPSFAGEGMSIALHSARLAAEAHLAGEGPQTYQRRLAKDVGLQVARATLASRLLVRPWSQPLIAAAMGLLPGGLGLAAAATRIPVKALARLPSPPLRLASAGGR
jgi:flavin-dependent dehydrogenase